MTDVSEQNLPGIGRSYTIPGIDGSRVVVVVHNTGRRDLYTFPAAEADTDEASVISFTDNQARRLGAVLGGAYFKPTVVAEVEAVIGSLLIDWVTLRDDSPGARRSISELEIRRQTRMTVVAITRSDDVLLAPEPDTILEPGDRLIVVGRQEDLTGFLRHVVG